MFQIILSCISQLWDVLCESLSSSPSQTPPSSPSHSIPPTNISQAPSSTVINSLASPSSQTPSSSASYSTRWDVFLSFRGSDTRNKFTSHLYDKLDSNGIQTFKDDPELRGGEVISDALLDAIRKSEAYIVVLSENYASSSWCLDELEEILNCYKTLHRLVIPVFYNIDPSVVRHLTKSFKQAFKKHHVRFVRETEKLNNWKLTLAEVASFSGYHISGNRSEADVINEIVGELLLKINPKTLDVAKYPVGLDSRVTAITTLLSSDKESVIRIGLHGMGGVGKTTLAKAVYNKYYRSFHGSCFLADVREASTRENGLVSLQQKLIDNVLKRKNERIDNVDQGIELIRARICSKKVLIVIDDLDNIMPLEFIVGPFAMGSIIIITTRNEDLLDSVRVEARYKVNGLGDVESRQLFIQHAFGDNKIPDTFTELSQEILEHAGGLPLALKVFGSNLLNQSEGDWRWFINKLKRVPIEDVENKLKISYQALKSVDPMLQNIYLDIACFFVGRKKDEVVNIMETCYTFVNRHIDILNKRCLLTTDDEDGLGMHDLLQDMGRNIARNESPDEPEKHSRLWVSKDICDVLKKKKGTEAVECIIPRDKNQDALRGLSFTTKTFKRMSKLRFLHLEEVNITGSFEQIFEDLRLLCWKDCPLRCLPSEFDPSKLVILELPRSKLRTVWDQNMVSHVFGKLKTLNMSYSRDLVATPDFIKLPSLETLNFKDCTSLEEVHISIGSLVRLDSLNLMGCEKLRSLPDTICDLRALKVLNISYCSSLKTLPIQLGNIESLKKLNASSLTVSKLPDSIGHLTKLVELNLMANQKLETLPDTICNLRSLEILDINDCDSLEALPTAIGNIESLKKFDVCGLTLSKLPDSIGNLTKLVELDLRDNKKLETLPDTICNLRNLEILSIKDCKKLETLLDELWKITRLRKLDASGAYMLKKLPDMGSSQIAVPLQELVLSFSGITALPSCSSQLSNLTSLELDNCYYLFSIPKLPPNLKCIKADMCKSLERLPNLSNLKHLETLDLSYCSGLTYIQGLEELTALRNLYLAGCSDFSDLTDKHLTKGLFKVYSEFGHQISVYVSKVLDQKSRHRWAGWITESPYWTSESSNSDSTVYAHLLPNESHNFMGMILCFNDPEDYKCSTFGFFVKNTTSGFIWRNGSLDVPYMSEVMVIVPKSIFSVRDDDHRIEFTADNMNIVGIHLLYNRETEMMEDVMKKHVINIDALKIIDPVLQDMFLDIACFFIGWEKKKVVQILETFYTNVDHNIDILKNRCLLTINARHELEMDDLLQHLGRKIARNNSLEEPEKHSRLWLSIDIYDVLKTQMGTELTEGIVPRKVDYQNALKGESFTLETFKKMRKLRFLYLKKVHLTGSFEQTFEDLRWLCWKRCPLKCLPSEFYPPKLVILELPKSSIITMWERNMVPHVFEKLKTLDMSGSEDLTTTPDFSKLPCLETLHLEGCKTLEEIHISIGSLVRLVSLDLHGCVKLRSLPDTICNLRALEVLDICDCSCLEALPMALGNIQSLRELNAGNLTISVLPDSIGHLSKLFKLRLNSNKNLKTLPVTICNLRLLEILDISGCEKLEMLPYQLWELTRLRELKAELPRNLKWISSNGCMYMERLPNLSNLTQLEYLKLEDCSGLTHIQGLKGLTSVRKLHLESCNSSLLAYIFTENFFQMYSQFGHPIQICSTKFPDWISQSSEYESMSLKESIESNEYYPTMSLNLPPNVSHNYLGMILCIRSSKSLTTYSVEKTASDFIWRGEFESYGYKSLMVIVPRSTFCVEDGDDKIILKANRRSKVYGIHLLYEPEEYDSTIIKEN